MKDFYYILGVHHDAALPEIKEAYRKLSKKFHPDLNDGDKYFETHFREVQEAYDTLSEPYKRSQYDMALANAGSGFSAGYSQQSAYRPQGQTYRTHRAGNYKGRRRGPGVGMSVVLVIIAVILGVYLVKYINHTKTQAAKQVAVVEVVPVKPHRLHKKRHSLKAKLSAGTSTLQTEKPLPAVIKTVPITVPVKALPVAKQVQSPPVSKSIPTISVNNIGTGSNGTYLYATYVQPNATGIINMRKYDAFNSEIIATVPASAKVFVLEKAGAYYKVLYNNYTGYVPKWALEVK